MRVFLLSFFFFLWANLLFSSFDNPYYLEAANVRTIIGDEVVFFANSTLNKVHLSLDYGVNERFLIGVCFPYLFFNSFVGDGVIGDIELKAKFLLEKDFFEFWRFSFLSIIRFPTGVVKEESYRYIDGGRYSFYPFSRGTFGFHPGFNLSFYFHPFMFWFNLFYCVDNYTDEGIVSFNPGLDRLRFSLHSDLEIEIFKFNNTVFLYLPELSISYQRNISSDLLFPDSLEIYFENSLKTGKFFKFSLGFLYPIIFDKKLYEYSLFLTFSFLF
ncbi:MAG: hypothetical protein ACP5Q5_03050 [Brevinematia bacterium]